MGKLIVEVKRVNSMLIAEEFRAKGDTHIVEFGDNGFSNGAMRYMIFIVAGEIE